MTAICRALSTHAVVLLALMGVGCSSAGNSGGGGPDPAGSQLVWPQPPEAPRIAFDAVIHGPRDLGIKPSPWRRLAGVLTGAGREGDVFVKPQAVAFDESGNLCVADPGSKAVTVLDLRGRRAMRWTRIGDHALLAPVGIARRSGITYVADTGLQAVLACDDRGRCRLMITNGLVRPAGVAVSSNRIYIADAAMHRISVHDLDGRLVRHLGRRGGQPGSFNAPTHVAIDPAGRLHVTDALNFRVQVLDGDGTCLKTFGGAGDGPGQFSRPKGVAVDAAGRIHVVDAMFDNVQIFDHAGRLLLHWGQAGSGPGEFWLPAGIAIDFANRIVVADSYNNRLQFFRYVGPP